MQTDKHFAILFENHFNYRLIYTDGTKHPDDIMDYPAFMGHSIGRWENGVLIVDEIGYLPIDRTGANLFFQLISRRYERGPMILTSNQSFGAWGDVFGDRVIATAILDRLLHHAVTLNVRGNSYRLKEKLKAGQGPSNVVALRAAGRKYATPVDKLADLAGKFAADLALLDAGERVAISHQATDRAIFARGALQAAFWLLGRAPGRYEMSEVIGFKSIT